MGLLTLITDTLVNPSCAARPAGVHVPSSVRARISNDLLEARSSRSSRLAAGTRCACARSEANSAACSTFNSSARAASRPLGVVAARVAAVRVSRSGQRGGMGEWVSIALSLAGLARHCQGHVRRPGHRADAAAQKRKAAPCGAALVHYEVDRPCEPGRSPLFPLHRHRSTLVGIGSTGGSHRPDPNPGRRRASHRRTRASHRRRSACCGRTPRSRPR